MALSDFAGQLGVDLSFASTGANFLQITLIFIFAILVTGGGFYWLWKKKSFNLYIEAWEDINGIPAPKIRDSAREIILPNTTTRAIQLRKSKIFLPRPSLQFGKNGYLYFIRSDGEWINIIPKSVNSQLKELNLWFDHSDMRLANASLKKLIEKSYKKLNWLKEWAPYIGFVILILMLAIAGYLVVGEAGKVAGGLASGGEKMANGAENMAKSAEAFERVAERLDRMLANLGGS